MSEGLATVQARISQLQALINPTAGGVASSSSGTAFAQALSGAAAGATPVSTASADAVITIAKKYLGVPYRWGGTDPDSGLDCSGLTQLVYGQVGVDLPRVSRDQAKSGTEVASMDEAVPGDLVFFGEPVHHVGIYLGDGKMLNAPHSGSHVRIEKLWGTPSHIRRVLPQEGTGDPLAQAGLGQLGLGQLGLGQLGLGQLGQLGAASTGSTTGGLAGGLAGTPFAELFTKAGARYGVDPALLSAIAKAESGYDADAISPAGARGLMQLMPGTAHSLGVDSRDPAQAVDGAARLMAENLRSFSGRVALALAAYNAGPGAVRRYGGIPPYEETRTYVQRVSDNWKDLR